MRRLLRVLTSVVLAGLAAFIATSWLAVALLSSVAPPTTSFMIQRSIENWMDGGRLRAPSYSWRGYDEISPDFALAVVAAEDQKFPRHDGFDFESIEQARQTYLAGGKLRGASTITQQLAKNLFLWPGRSYLRKALEAYFTVLIESLWSKRRILETYMNTVELGDMVFGVEAGSEVLLGKSGRDLSPGDAALLAAVLPNPRKYRADAPSQYVRKRRREILVQMSRLGADYLDSLDYAG